VYDYGEFIELFNPYDVDVEVRIVGIHKQDGTGRPPITVTVPAQSYRVIGDKSGYYYYTDASGDEQTKIVPDTGGHLPAEANAPDCYDINLDDGGGSIQLQTSGSHIIEVAEYGSEASEPGTNQTWQKNDPRVNKKPDDSTGWELTSGTPKAQNKNWEPSGSGDADPDDTPLEKLFVVNNGPIGCIGHLGHIHTGKPWETIDLVWDASWDVTTWKPDDHATWLNLYDLFTPASDVDRDLYGLININTAPVEVLQGLKGVDSAIANSIFSHVTKDQRFESVSELSYIFRNLGDNNYDRERYVADIANLVTVRSQVFRVTVLAQAVDRQGNKCGERKLEASVLRTVDPATGEFTVRVLSMRWLVED